MWIQKYPEGVFHFMGEIMLKVRNGGLPGEGSSICRAAEKPFQNFEFHCVLLVDPL